MPFPPVPDASGDASIGPEGAFAYWIELGTALLWTGRGEPGQLFAQEGRSQLPGRTLNGTGQHLLGVAQMKLAQSTRPWPRSKWLLTDLQSP